MISSRDDLRHLPGPEQNYSESKWFCFYDPRRDLYVSSRIGLESNRRKANRWFVAALNGGILYRDLRTDLPIPDEEWDSLGVSGLRYETLDPMRSYRVAFDSPEFACDVTWVAGTPVFDYKDCNRPLPPALAAEHYEQSGTVRGSFRIDEVVQPLEGTGHRDHSWGVRHWEGFASWVAFMARLSGDTYFHLEKFHERGLAVSSHGFISEHGSNAPVRSADIKLEFAEQSEYPRAFTLDLEDTRGSRLLLAGEVRFTCPFRFGSCAVGESYGSFRYGGQSYPGIIEYGFTP